MTSHINEKTAQIHRESVAKAFGAKPAPAKEPSKSEASAKELQDLLGSDVQVKPQGKKAGGKISSASKRADGCAVRGKTKGRML